MQSKDLGELAQAEFICAAMRRGFSIAEPFGDNEKYDFIIDNGLKLLKIQVKSTSCFIDKKDCYQVSTCYGSSKKELYNHKQIDFFAVYIIPIDMWYIIPVYSVTTPSIRIYHDSKVSKLSVFKEQWELLKN